MSSFAPSRKDGDPFKDPMAQPGPLKVWRDHDTGQLKQARLRPPSAASRDNPVDGIDELLRGLSAHDLRSTPTGFRNFAQAQSKTADYDRTAPSPEGSYDHSPFEMGGGSDEDREYGEEAGSEREQSDMNRSQITPGGQTRPNLQTKPYRTDNSPGLPQGSDNEDILNYQEPWLDFPDSGDTQLGDQGGTPDDRPYYKEEKRSGGRDIIAEIEGLFDDPE